MLTARQQQLLAFIDSCAVAPTYDEMRAGLGLKSKSGVHRLVDQIEERGFIRRLRGKARAIEVVRRPEARTAWRVVLQHAIAIAERRGFSPIELIGSRAHAAVGRDELAWTLQRVEGWSNLKIEAEIGRSRWWVSHAIERHEQRLKSLSPVKQEKAA